MAHRKSNDLSSFFLPGLTAALIAGAVTAASPSQPGHAQTQAEGSARSLASVGGLSAAIDGLANASRLTRFEVTQVLERTILKGASVSAIIGTSSEAAALNTIIRNLEKSNSPLAQALQLDATSKSQAIADLKQVQAQVAAAAKSGTDAGSPNASGFGVPCPVSAKTLSDWKALSRDQREQMISDLESTRYGTLTPSAEFQALNLVTSHHEVSGFAELAQKLPQHKGIIKKLHEYFENNIDLDVDDDHDGVYDLSLPLRYEIQFATTRSGQPVAAAVMVDKPLIDTETGEEDTARYTVWGYFDLSSGRVKRADGSEYGSMYFDH